MIKRLAPIALLVLSVACSSIPMHSSSTDSSGKPAGPSTLDASSYILLDAPNQVRSVDWSTQIYPLHIYGAMTNKGFTPIGNKIEGHGKLCSDGKDFLSLTDLKVYKASDGKTPQAPYVVGCATASGFQPASLDIVAQ
jgi:hypothetical protein